PDATAGTYTVRTCHGSHNQSVATTDGVYGWQATTIGLWPGYGLAQANGCDRSDAAGALDHGLVAVNDRTVVRPVNSGLGWTYRAAPATTISAYRLWLYGGAR